MLVVKNEDLGIKIGNKEESKWTNIKKQAENAILESNVATQINKAIIGLAEKKIALEQKPLNKTDPRN